MLAKVVGYFSFKEVAWIEFLAPFWLQRGSLIAIFSIWGVNKWMEAPSLSLLYPLLLKIKKQ